MRNVKVSGDIARFMKDVFRKFDRELDEKKRRTITGEIFMTIQNNKVFLKRYWELVDDVGNKGTLNQRIGKMVKVYFGFEDKDKDGRENNPKSDLITSYQRYR